MMKKTLLAAAVAAMTVSGGAWAACSAAIDMGTNAINNLADPTSAQDAATKAYVDAANALEFIVNPAMGNMVAQAAFCASQGAGWRIPSIEESAVIIGQNTNNGSTHDLDYIVYTASATENGTLLSRVFDGRVVTHLPYDASYGVGACVK